ncbi:MAG: shikimate kinase [Rhodospirillales bacterium]|nr:shikimate kinase [Rhodospirillales bacterium]
MQLIFVYGPIASGKLTIAREVCRATGLALFHNHLVVDAVAAVFPFGSEPFRRLREQLWRNVIEEAALQGRSLVFTFAPEPTVSAGFPEQLRAIVHAAGGEVIFVRLQVPVDEQERRIGDQSRFAFGKLRSVEILRGARADHTACEAAMPQPDLTIDTSTTSVADAATAISALVPL